MGDVLQPDTIIHRLILDRLPLGVALIRDSRIRWANPAMAEILGCDLPCLAETSLDAFFLDPGDYRQLFQAAIRALSEGREFHAEAPLRRRDGEAIWTRLALQTQSGSRLPIRPASGTSPRDGAADGLDGVLQGLPILLLLQDVTAARQNEDRLRQFQRAIEFSPTSIVITDAAGDIQYVNPRFTLVTGYSMEEALGQNPRILKSGLTSPETYENLWETLLAGSEWRGEFANRRKNGEIYWEAVSISPLFDAAGRISHFVAIKDEITQRKELELRLQRQNEQLAALHSAALDLLTRRSPEALLQALLGQALALLNSQLGEVLLLEGGELTLWAETETSGQPLYQPMRRSQSPLAWLSVETRRPEVQNNYRTWARRSDRPTAPCSVACFPILSGRLCLGVLCLGRSVADQPYDDEDVQVGALLAQLAALALQNARLYGAAQAEIGERLAAEYRYRSLYEQTHDAVFLLDLDGHHIQANRRAAELLGYSTEEIQDLDAGKISAEPDQTSSMLQRLRLGEYIPTYERLFRRKDGSVVPVEINVELVRDETGVPLHIQSVVRDISERKQAEQALHDANRQLKEQLEEIRQLQDALREQAIRDPLTGLHNRRFLSEMLPKELARVHRDGEPLSIVVLDIDHFKRLNDTYCHDAGDRALKLLAAVLQRMTRSGDIVCRYGGEEFLLALPRASLGVAIQRAEDLRLAVENLTVELPQGPVSFTISLGVAGFPQDGRILEDIVTAADLALYRAKRDGRNRVSA